MCDGCYTDCDGCYMRKIKKNLKLIKLKEAITGYGIIQILQYSVVWNMFLLRMQCYFHSSV